MDPRTLLVYLTRHAPNQGDELIEAGRQLCEQAQAWFQALNIRLVWHSEANRAVQTGECLGLSRIMTVQTDFNTWSPGEMKDGVVARAKKMPKEAMPPFATLVDAVRNNALNGDLYAQYLLNKAAASYQAGLFQLVNEMIRGGLERALVIGHGGCIEPACGFDTMPNEPRGRSPSMPTGPRSLLPLETVLLTIQVDENGIPIIGKTQIFRQAEILGK